jgi:hypothetical protein
LLPPDRSRSVADAHATAENLLANWAAHRAGDPKSRADERSREEAVRAYADSAAAHVDAMRALAAETTASSVAARSVPTPRDRLLEQLATVAKASSSGSKRERAAAMAELDARLTELQEVVSDERRDETLSGEFGAAQWELYSGRRGVKTCTATGMRYVLMSSAFLAESAGMKTRSGHSRCGLSIGFDSANMKGTATFIIGAYRLGRGMDTSAVRKPENHAFDTRTDESGVLLNLCIEWVSADELENRCPRHDMMSRKAGLVGNVAPEWPS